MALDMMPGARAILLANPVNPTAQVYDSDEIHGIIDVCAANRVFCIIDRLYATLIYDGARFPWLQPDPAVREWCILVDGVARAFRGLGGLKIGWACGPRDVIEAAGIAQDCASGPAGRVEQRVALAALDSPFDLGVLEELQMARDVFLERVRAVKDIEAWPVAGTMYCILDFRRFIGRTTPVGWILESSGDIADFLLREAGVLVTPGDSVGLPGLVRVSFASPLDEITVAVSAIEYALSLLTPV
jgi:aspartate aminotransferase